LAFFSDDIVQQVEAVARIKYLGREEVRLWNENKRDGELRLLSGYMWTAKDGSAHQQGLKTYSAALRDAWYVLVHKRAVPSATQRRAKLRVVA
jgi:hypothetical protein